MDKKICTQCGTYAVHKKKLEGHLGIEIILWLFFLVPGIFYSVWRWTTYKERCDKCHSSALIPAESPIGKKLRSEYHPFSHS